MFDHIEQGRRLKKDDQQPGTIPFVMAGTTNTGVVGYISNPVASFPANSITVDIFGNTFYRNYAFGAGDDTGVYWNTAKEYSETQMLFLTSMIERALLGKFSFGHKLRSSQSFDLKVTLPIKSHTDSELLTQFQQEKTNDFPLGKSNPCDNISEIDFDFMESFIRELEEERIRELSAYLTVSGLSDTKLSDREEAALLHFNDLDWQEFNVQSLFGKSTRGKRLKSDDRIEGDLPFVTAGEAEEGISAFISNDVEVFSKNTTTIDMFGSAKYRNYDYGADDHVAVVHTENLPKHAAIFVTTSCHKSAHNGQFNYGHNFYAKDADTLDIMLPVKDGKPDYDTMETFISAVQKLVIKDVVQYADKKITATKEVTYQKTESYGELNVAEPEPPYGENYGK